MKKLLILCMIAICLFGCSKKNDAVEINIAQKAEELLKEEQFKGIGALNVDKLELKYAADLSELEEGVFYLPMDSERANMFIIAKAKEGKADILFDEIDMIVDKYCHSWTDLVYNAEEAAKVEKHTVKMIGDYYICVISDNNDAVIKLITE